MVLLIKNACDHNSDAMHMACAVQVVCRELIAKSIALEGFLKQTSEQDAVPPSLMALVNIYT